MSDQRETTLVAEALGSGMEKGQVRRLVLLNEESAMVFLVGLFFFLFPLLRKDHEVERLE